MKSLRPLPVLVVLVFILSFSGCMHGPDREGSFTRELTVSGKTVLDVQSGAGAVSVRPGSGDKVTVRARIRARGLFTGMSGAEKVKRIQDNPPVVQQGSTVRVGKIGDSELRKDVFIDYDITLPADAQINISTGAGNINLRSLKGPVRATTGAGTILAEDLADDVRLESGAGAVDVRGARGRLDAKSGAGSIKASGEPKKDWRLEVGAGSIHVEAPGDASFELEAETGIGKVTVSPDFHLKASSTSNSRVYGTVGNGGPVLYVNNGAGSIDIAAGAGRN
jgi:hypothetical protein